MAAKLQHDCDIAASVSGGANAYVNVVNEEIPKETTTITTTTTTTTTASTSNPQSDSRALQTTNPRRSIVSVEFVHLSTPFFPPSCPSI